SAVWHLEQDILSCSGARASPCGPERQDKNEEWENEKLPYIPSGGTGGGNPSHSPFSVPHSPVRAPAAPERLKDIFSSKAVPVQPFLDHIIANARSVRHEDGALGGHRDGRVDDVLGVGPVAGGEVAGEREVRERREREMVGPADARLERRA